MGQLSIGKIIPKFTLICFGGLAVWRFGGRAAKQG
jgi:hypothetical protein